MTTRNNQPAIVNIAPQDEEIAALVGCIRQWMNDMERLEDQVQAAKNRLRVLLAERGDNWTDDLGYARLMPDTKRTSYDTRALDLKIIKNPKKYGWLKRMRKAFVVKGYVSVK